MNDNERVSAADRAQESVERGALLPESATERMAGEVPVSGLRIRSREFWDEYGPGAEIETTPPHVTDGWGWFTATSEEWDRIEAELRPFKAGFLDALRGVERKSTHPTYLAGYAAHGR